MYTTRQMATFFASLVEQTNTVASPGSPIVNTMMGPFTFNAATQSWTNVNNGMRISNAEFQNMMSAGDYTTNSSDSSAVVVVVVPSGPSNFAITPLNFTGGPYSTSSNYGTGASAWTSVGTIAGNTTGTKLKWGLSGTTSNALIGDIYYRRNGVEFSNALAEGTAFPFVPPSANWTSGQTIQLGVKANSLFNGVFTQSIELFNVNDGNTSCSNKITFIINCPDNRNAFIVGSDFGTKNYLNMPIAGTTYFTGGDGPTTTFAFGNSNLIGGNNAPFRLTASLTGVQGTTPGIFGTTFGTSAMFDLLTSGLTVGFTRDAFLNLQNNREAFQVAIVTPTTPGSGSGFLQLVNTSTGQNFSTGVTYSYATSDITPTLSPSSWGGLTGMSVVDIEYYAASGGASTDEFAASVVEFLNMNTTIQVSITDINSTGAPLERIEININGKAWGEIVSGNQFGVQPDDNLRIRAVPNTSCSGILRVRNESAGTILQDISYGFTEVEPT